MKQLGQGIRWHPPNHPFFYHRLMLWKTGVMRDNGMPLTAHQLHFVM